MNYTKGEWKACQNGKCRCKQIWCDDYPIATVNSGKWGDDYPSIRLVGESSLDLKAEAFIEQITYGKIPENIARANALLIAAAPDLYQSCLSALGIMATLNQTKGWVREISGVIQKALAKAEGKDV